MVLQVCYSRAIWPPFQKESTQGWTDRPLKSYCFPYLWKWSHSAFISPGPATQVWSCISYDPLTKLPLPSKCNEQCVLPFLPSKQFLNTSLLTPSTTVLTSDPRCPGWLLEVVYGWYWCHTQSPLTASTPVPPSAMSVAANSLHLLTAAENCSWLMIHLLGGTLGRYTPSLPRSIH